MTKQEAKKLGNAIIDYLVSLAGDIKRSNVLLEISDLDDDPIDCEASVQMDSHSKIFLIKLNMTPKSTEAYIVRAVCHELAHIFNWEWLHFYNVFIDIDDGSEMAKKEYDNADESTAYRQEDIYVELWKLHTRKGSK